MPDQSLPGDPAAADEEAMRQAEEAMRQRVFQRNLAAIVETEISYAADLQTLITSLEKTPIQASNGLMKTRAGKLFAIEIKNVLPLLKKMLVLSQAIGAAYGGIENKEGAPYAIGITDVLKAQFSILNG